MKVLITNDDGVQAEGINVLFKELSRHHDCLVMAPDREQSATSHSLTLTRPLRMNRFHDNFYSCDGTPTDSVLLAVLKVLNHVKPDMVEAFKAATLENARNSVREPGVARFDVVQQSDDPTRFVLVEVYRTPEDAARHKDTAHYPVWRDAVADMMAEPRRSVKYDNVFPDDVGWG